MTRSTYRLRPGVLSVSLVVKIKLTNHETKLSEKEHLSKSSGHRLRTGLCCARENGGERG